MDEQRCKDLIEIQDLFNAINKNTGLDWNQHDKTGLSLSQIFILEVLASEGRRRPSDLASIMHITTGGITSLLHRLVDRDLVTKITDEQDRRVIRLEITEAGKSVLTDALHQRDQMIDRLFGSLENSDIQYLKEIGQKLLNNFQK